jgi:excisionase family DNA binding protein
MTDTYTPPAPTPTILPLLVDVGTAAQLLGLSPRTLWSLTRRGELPCRRVGRRVLYSRAALAAYAEGRPL